jgi:rhamnosyltransferase subunit A
MDIEKIVVQTPQGHNIYVEHQTADPSFDTVIMVNGAMSTTAAFNHTVKYLKDGFNTLCFDLPFSGQSRPLNPRHEIITKDDEVEILSFLIDHFQPAFLLSISWGGLASLLALARKKTSIKRAVIASFSPFLNPAMYEYILEARNLIAAGENSKAAKLLNDTVGKYMPRLGKFYNYRYLSALPNQEFQQVFFHIEQILSLQPALHLREMQNIDIDVLFVNGTLDEYTTAADVKFVAPYLQRAHFATVNNAGHFLDLEGRQQQAEMRELMFDFYTSSSMQLNPNPTARQMVMPV